MVTAYNILTASGKKKLLRSGWRFEGNKKEQEELGRYT